MILQIINIRTQVTIIDDILVFVVTLETFRLMKGDERMKFDLNNPGLKKGLGIASVVFAGLMAVANALSDQKREQEFEEMKKTLSELQNK